MSEILLTACIVAIWAASSVANYYIMNWGGRRLSRAYGHAYTGMDRGDWVLLAFLALYGPFGAVFGYFFTDWWCSGFEDDGGQKPQGNANRKVQAKPIIYDPSKWTGRP